MTALRKTNVSQTLYQTLQTTKMNFEFQYRQVCPSLLPFVFVMLLLLGMF